MFNPSLGEDNVRVVGTCQFATSGKQNHGVIYQGPPDGKGGVWKQIDVLSSAVGGKSVYDTIPHSTMGDLVVGNYDLQIADDPHGSPATGNAFIYNLAKDKWTIFQLGGPASFTTAYGIWQNGIGNASYTIVGGTRDDGGLNKGFVVNYNSETDALTNLKLYEVLLPPFPITHFEGITRTAGGYNLAGQTTNGIALFASITVEPDGSFSEAEWRRFSFPDSTETTGNTVYQNNLMGIYTMSGQDEIRSYVATFA